MHRGVRHIRLESPHAAPAPFLRVKPSAFYQCQHLGFLAGRTLWEAAGQSMLVCWPRRGSRQGEGKETRPCFGESESGKALEPRDLPKSHTSKRARCMRHPRYNGIVRTTTTAEVTTTSSCGPVKP